MSEPGTAAVPSARVMQLTAGSGGRRTILAGPPGTGGMRAGVVVLDPGGAVGRHNTGRREEFIVVLEGRGEVHVEGSPPLPLERGAAAYVPAHREHDVVNPSERPLHYVYVVAPLAGDGPAAPERGR